MQNARLQMRASANRINAKQQFERWSKQMNPKTSLEDMTQSLYSFSGKQWENWYATLQHSLTIPWGRLYIGPLELMEKFGNATLQFQRECIRTQLTGLRSDDGKSTAFDEWVEKAQSLADGMNGAQRDIWNTWIKAVKELKPEHFLMPLPSTLESMTGKTQSLQFLQEAVRNSVALQEDVWATLSASEPSAAERGSKSSSTDLTPEKSRKSAHAA